MTADKVVHQTNQKIFGASRWRRRNNGRVKRQQNIQSGQEDVRRIHSTLSSVTTLTAFWFCQRSPSAPGQRGGGGGGGGIKHCHDNSHAQEDREREKKVARKRLYVVSVVCLIFMIGEILGESALRLIDPPVLSLAFIFFLFFIFSYPAHLPLRIHWPVQSVTSVPKCIIPETRSYDI